MISKIENMQTDENKILKTQDILIPCLSSIRYKNVILVLKHWNLNLVSFEFKEGVNIFQVSFDLFLCLAQLGKNVLLDDNILQGNGFSTFFMLNLAKNDLTVGIISSFVNV